jgi:hypothetical protein
MATGIAGSVGNGADNQRADVKRVQQLLAPFAKNAGLPPIIDDGLLGAATIAAIERFQAQVMKFPAPDGRIDPGGKTWAALVAWSDPIKVIYGPGVEPEARLVDDYSFAVIRKALALAEMKAAVITSTLRFPQEQAAAMYKNAVRDFAGQRALYGPTGDEILQVYAANKGKQAEAVIDLMRAKIEKLVATGRPVSLHVTTKAGYAKRNVIDIGLNSTREAAGASFDQKALTRAFAKLAEQDYVAKFIDETAKSNCCWHLEIVPGAKKL